MEDPREQANAHGGTADYEGVDMEQSTETMQCGNCGVPIVPCAVGYTHIPDLGTPGIACNDPRPIPTKTVAVTDIRRTTPALFAALGCMMAHTFRVVLKGKEPIALECVRCATTWTTERERLGD